ncbi:alpha/beta fold hydrolase [Actinomadura barringtoniae]|uniref:Alpha/beta fold hydrolase n=1 Tax=Actinomadura barringtoniae TaxID=1427535 RepID=A0A939PD69_9ACTN|nr:alpha/beta fold hydrolase [Actinomadura barringtoniae]MBO2447509.1 alpha/beta fold hydrolase [Actinomadura barringtoniae]
MKLKVHELGEGDKVALLVHGIMASHGTWCRVAPLLVGRGYRVVMPDLRGHGDSPHTAEYSPELFAGDLADSLPTGADVAIGHSLGALSLSLAVERLRPAKAVYSDPAWKLAGNPMGGQREQIIASVRSATAESILRLRPKWSPEDVEAELEGYAAWDPTTLDWLAGTGDHIPDRPVVPSLVQAAGDKALVNDGLADQLRSRGFEVTFVQDTGHCVHRDDLDGFMRSLDGWI